MENIIRSEAIEIYRNRLERWANYLFRVPPNKFDIDQWVEVAPNLKESLADTSCGTSGCAAGYLPLIFPEDWGYNEIRMTRHSEPIRIYPVLLSESNYDSTHVVFYLMSYFGLPEIACKRIIFRDYYRLRKGDDLSRWVTPKRVARRIKTVAFRNGMPIILIP